ncbi:TetR/AcrR family transcriptional regulator [Agromyces seonyuensis]|uniref:TetR family transcriptional regulator n=1 Tax=Agromyces seonyuensis TaxID=2662446 RepID=A0A6I4NVP6_9MICO|nr:TetR/AcrR family transcriptional regulator [Agromyces seonyuensis]MWB98171.1 TetR family transcriptional regulator [Agromyces seonyuensis]
MTRPANEPLGRPTDAELTARILAATGELLIERGYAGLKIEQIAKRVGCGKTAIYRRWPDKAALTAASVLEHTEVGEEPDTGDVVIDLVLHATQNQTNQARGTAAAAQVEGYSPWRVVFEPEVFPLIWSALFEQRRDQGVHLIERGIERGQLPADTDAELILDTIAGLTLYRQSVKGTVITPDQYRVIAASLVADPPRAGSAARG